MTTPSPDDTSPDRPKDLLDTRLGQRAVELERSIGSSCLLSMVLILFVLVFFRRYLNVPWPALIILSTAAWFALMVILARWQPFDRDEDR